MTFRSKLGQGLAARAPASVGPHITGRVVTCSQATPYLFAALAAAALAAYATQTGDYGLGTQSGDSPAPVIHALLRGDLSGALSQQPVMGLFSILLRLPFAALVSAIGGGELLTYRLGTFACALVLGLVGIAITAAARTRGRSWLGAGAIVALGVLNPLTFDAITRGHPEEILAGALCVASVLAALHNRPLLAGAALGAAIGTKEWTLLAVIPTLMACRSGRLRVAALALAVAAPLALAMPLADPAAFLRAAHKVGGPSSITVTSWWWAVAGIQSFLFHGSSVAAAIFVQHLPLGLRRSEVSWLALAAALPLGWAFRRNSERDPADALGLLALLLLLRCTLDSETWLYYQVPFVIALVAWEVLTRRGLPLISLAAVVGLSGTYDELVAVAHRGVAYLLLTLGLVACLTVCVFKPRRRFARIRHLAGPRRPMIRGTGLPQQTGQLNALAVASAPQEVRDAAAGLASLGPDG